MLDFSDQPYRYFPPKRSPVLAWVLNLYNRLHFLPRVKNVRRVSVSGDTAAIAKHHQRDHLLIVPNHPTHVDAYVYQEALRQVGVSSHIMAAYDVFLRSKLDAWIMQHLGVFSVDREGSDQQAMKQATQTLTEGKHALTIFPEGNVYLQNDRVTPFHEGAVFIALRAAKTLAEQNKRIVIAPMSIKLTHTSDIREQMLARLHTLAERMEADVAKDGSLMAQLTDIGLAGLYRHLQARGLTPPEHDGSLPSLITETAAAIVDRLETKMDTKPRPKDSLIERIRKLRRAIHDIRIDEARKTDHAMALHWADEAMLALRIASYAGDYVTQHPTIDRIAETVEKLCEDATGEIQPSFGERAAFVHFNEPIDAGDYLESFSKKARIAVRELTDRCEQAVQAGVDQLNEQNPHAGGTLLE